MDLELKGKYALITGSVREHPDIEILVNNLGIFEPKPFEQISDDDWRRFFEVNVLSGVRFARLVLPGVKKLNWGRIIFISSESAVQIPAEMIHYGMSKTAQLAVSRGLAEAVAGTGITVNSVRCPGRHDRAASAISSKRWRKRKANRSPSMRRHFLPMCDPRRW